MNAYPSFTKYDDINRTPPSFLMIDMDLKDFASKDKLDRATNRILAKIESQYATGDPTVLWTGNGYHIYRPIAGFILEEEEVFAEFIDSYWKGFLPLNLCNLQRIFLQIRKEIPQTWAIFLKFMFSQDPWNYEFECIQPTRPSTSPTIYPDHKT